jgi:hypothetical protein
VRGMPSDRVRNAVAHYACVPILWRRRLRSRLNRRFGQWCKSGREVREMDFDLWQRPRWGVGSVRLHLDVEDLALALLLFDRVVVPKQLPQGSPTFQRSSNGHGNSGQVRVTSGFHRRHGDRCLRRAGRHRIEHPARHRPCTPGSYLTIQAAGRLSRHGISTAPGDIAYLRGAYRLGRDDDMTAGDPES